MASEPSDWDPLPEPTVEVWQPGVPSPAAPAPAPASVAQPPVPHLATRRPRAQPEPPPLRPVPMDQRVSLEAEAQAREQLAVMMRKADPRLQSGVELAGARHTALSRALDRMDRRRRALLAPFVEWARPVAARWEDTRLGSAEREVAAGEVDDRERADWFLRLPEHEQQRLREHWRARGDHVDVDALRSRAWLQRSAIEGAVLFTFVGIAQFVFCGGGGFLPLVLAFTIAGALAAALAQLLDGGRFLFALLGALAWAVVGIPTLGAGVISAFGLLVSQLATFGMGALGMDREMRRSGGFREA